MAYEERKTQGLIGSDKVEGTAASRVLPKVG
jgi:hypothetical protein